MKAQPTPYWKDVAHRDAFKIARDITARHARSFYLSAQLLPAEQRWATYGLYGFCRFADNLIDEPDGLTDAALAERLGNLRATLLEAYAEGASDDPVVHAFITVARRHAIPSDLPLELLTGVEMDIGECRYATYDDLHTYCYRVAGVVGLMMTHVLGHTSPDAFPYAEKLGVAMQLTNILRDIDEDRRMGRIYLPADEMAAHGVLESDILEGRMSEQLRDLMAFQASRSHAGYREAEPGIELLYPRSQFAIRSASRIYRGILKKIEARGFDPFLGRVFVPGRNKAGIVLWEALRSGIPSLARRYPGLNHS